MESVIIEGVNAEKLKLYNTLVHEICEKLYVYVNNVFLSTKKYGRDTNHKYNIYVHLFIKDEFEVFHVFKESKYVNPIMKYFGEYLISQGFTDINYNFPNKSMDVDFKWSDQSSSDQSSSDQYTIDRC
jgi:hypothetical protein